MSEGLTAAAPTPPAAEANGQLIVSFATVLILGALGGGLILVGLKTEGAAILGSIVGALANSLNSPTGIGNVLRGAAAAPKALPVTVPLPPLPPPPGTSP